MGILRHSSRVCEYSNAAAPVGRPAYRSSILPGLRLRYIEALSTRPITLDITNFHMSNPFLDNAFHIRWSQLVPAAIEPDITTALEQAQTAIDALAAPPGEDEPLTGEDLLQIGERIVNLERLMLFDHHQIVI